MKILTEFELRAMCLGSDASFLSVAPDVFITPGAKEYLRDRGIELVIEEKADGRSVKSYNFTSDGYVDYLTGRTYDSKPEHMTHIRGNALVMKNHPRIAFRGRLDSLEARIVACQLAASEQGCSALVDELGKVYDFTRNILSAEVNEKKIESIELLGMNSQRLRYVSHHVFEEFGVNHAVPDYRSGRLCVELNLLRTSVRETELAAVAAFGTGEGVTRPDIIEALNRLSSCVYILYCKARGGKYNVPQKKE